MGDRRQVEMVFDGDSLNAGERSIWLYVHYVGEDLPGLVQSALDRGKGRWEDEPYLSRIITSEIFDHIGIKEETGAGLYLASMDSDYESDVRVDLGKGTVMIGSEGWTFEDFLKVTQEKLKSI